MGIACLLGITSTLSVRANGINGDGVDAVSMAMGGTDIGWAQSPLEAMGDNPAGLGFLSKDEIDFGGIAASADGHFSKSSAGSSGDLDSNPEGLPDGAVGIRLGKLPVSIGISFVPQSMLLANWHYVDPPGADVGSPDFGVSYGYQQDKSEILVLRSALGAGVSLGDYVSIGLSIGAVYNKNELVTPYIFQNLSAPDGGVDGAKTLLDLDTGGFGWNAQIGLLYRPLTNLQFGLSYQNKYTVVTTGSASGNAYAQFGGTPSSTTYAFHYDAEVDNTFPDHVNIGGSWKFLPNWRLAAQVDWIDWAHAFNSLPVKLSNGTGPTGPGSFIPANLGTSFSNNIPLDWESELVYRTGLEYAVLNNLSLRVGYSFGRSPVPNTTLTPMTAAIMENTITAGVGYRWRACEFDMAYGYDLPMTRNVQNSTLLSGEYSNSSTQVAVNWLALTMSFKF